MLQKWNVLYLYPFLVRPNAEYIRNIGRLNACFQNVLHYSTVSPTNDSYANYFVHSLGFEHRQALSISTKLFLRRKNKVIDTKFVDNANSVVTLFRNLGFRETHIRKVVSWEPNLLASNVDSNLKPKIRLLQDEDFNRSDIIRVISSCPAILLYGLAPTILPLIRVLRQVMGCTSNVVNTIERLREAHFRNIIKCLLPNVSLLSSHGIPIELIRKQLLYKPGYFVRNPEVFRDIVMSSEKNLGITRYSPMNLYGVNLISGMNEETFESRCQILKSLGANQSFSDYLVNHIGFSRQQALFTCTKLSQQRKNKMIDSEFIDNANSVVTLFQKHGFDNTLIRNIVSKEPRLLASNVDRTLKPKLRALQDEDFSAFDIIRVISRRPSILWHGLESTILPAIHQLKRVMGSVGNVVNTIEKNNWHFRSIIRCLLPNISLLTGYGVPIELIRKHLLYHSGYYVQNPEAFKHVVIRVEKKLGITRDLPMFLYGINFVSGMSEETFESKCRVFKSFGWTQADIETYIKKNASCSCLTVSAELIKKKLGFLMNELQLSPAYLISHNGFLTCSLEKRILPRHMILQTLKERSLVKQNPSLYSAIIMSEPCFLKTFVLPIKEVHEAYAKLTGCSLKMLTADP